MRKIRNSVTVIFIAFVTMLGGCAAVAPAVIKPPQPPTIIVEQQPAEVSIIRNGDICGDLARFTLDISKLDGQQQKQLLDSMLSEQAQYFSCNHLKTGLLLSQIGQTIAEDNLALAILEEYQKDRERTIPRLSSFEHFLLQLTIQQATQHKRLHTLLSNLGDQLIAQKTISKTMTDDLLTLQQKLNQLQKIEADINETEQSIATPATTGLTTDTAKNTGS